MNSPSKKYSEELATKVFKDLRYYAKWLVKSYANRGHWFLNFDDLLSEMYLSLALCLNKYHTKDYEELLVLTRYSMRNRIFTLLSKAGLTHRKVELNMASMQDDDIHVVDEMSDPALIYDDVEHFEEKLSLLSELDRKVVDAILGGNSRVRIFLDLSIMRSNWTAKNPSVSITPLIVARALCVPVKDVKKSYKNIESLFSS